MLHANRTELNNSCQKSLHPVSFFRSMGTGKKLQKWDDTLFKVPNSWVTNFFGTKYGHKSPQIPKFSQRQRVDEFIITVRRCVVHRNHRPCVCSGLSLRRQMVITGVSLEITVASERLAAQCARESDVCGRCRVRLRIIVAVNGNSLKIQQKSKCKMQWRLIGWWKLRLETRGVFFGPNTRALLCGHWQVPTETGWLASRTDPPRVLVVSLLNICVLAAFLYVLLYVKICWPENVCRSASPKFASGKILCRTGCIWTAFRRSACTWKHRGCTNC